MNHYMFVINLWLHLEQEKNGFCNTAHVESREIYPIETTNNLMKVVKDNLLVSNIMKHLPIHKVVQFLTIGFRLSRSMCLPVYWWQWIGKIQPITFFVYFIRTVYWNKIIYWINFLWIKHKSQHSNFFKEWGFLDLTVEIQQ